MSRTSRIQTVIRLIQNQVDDETIRMQTGYSKQQIQMIRRDMPTITRDKEQQ